MDAKMINDYQSFRHMAFQTAIRFFGAEISFEDWMCELERLQKDYPDYARSLCGEMEAAYTEIMKNRENTGGG